MQDLYLVGKLILAAVFGGIVGYEREVHEHPAGLRTHILVCMGSALITMVSVSLRPGAGDPPIGDPGRIAAQIVSGIGFLGAGTILRQGNIVRGLTTAASLWTVAGIGIAVGVGGSRYLMLAAVATGIVFITLSTMRGFEPAGGAGKRVGHSLYLEMPAERLDALGEIMQHFVSIGGSVYSTRTMPAPAEDKRAFKLKIALPRKAKVGVIIERLAAQEGLDRFEWS